MGNAARQASFLVTHGLGSGVGVNNPPLFIYFMGLVTFFTNNPLYITAIFMLLNALVLFLALRYFYLTLPRTYAILSSLLLAFSAAFTIYSEIIWAQCLLPFLMILFQINLYKLIKEEKGYYFIFLGILTALASQLHLSGFFLFPVLIILAILCRKKISIKIFMITALFILIILLPYLYHLFFEKELAHFLLYGKFIHRHIYWKVFREHLRMASFDFFRYYFRYDFNDVLNKSMGIIGFILYPLSCILIALFISGWLYYLIWLIRGRKIFNITEEKRYPLSFQIAGFMILVVTLGYLVLRVQTPMHYLILLFPFYSLITGFMAYKIWNFFWAKIIISVSILSTAILLLSIILFLKRAGGHPYEYGPSYQALLNWKREIQQILPKRFCPDLSIRFLGKGKFDFKTINAVMMDGYKCKENEPNIPINFIVTWNPYLLHYEYTIEVKQIITQRNIK
jgi:hypothetical protein